MKKRSGLSAYIEKRWYGKPGFLLCLMPLSWLFSVVSRTRKSLQQRNAHPADVPLVVVGNISVGGTGKTPTLIALVKFLQSRGMCPGVVSRGYGRVATDQRIVSSESSAEEVGDEPLVIYNATRCVVAVGADRIDSINQLVSHGCDIILADDGLQHYRMARDKEVIVVDAERLFGNAHLLPVGPLREPPGRIGEADWVLVNGADHCTEPFDFGIDVPTYSIGVLPTAVTRITTGEVLPLDTLATLNALTAVAGIGNPDKFFATLSGLDVKFEQCVFPDHHQYCAGDFLAFGDKPIVMTEKDAVKCKSFVSNSAFFLNIEMRLPDEFLEDFYQLTIKGLSTL